MRAVRGDCAPAQPNGWRDGASIMNADTLPLTGHTAVSCHACHVAKNVTKITLEPIAMRVTADDVHRAHSRLANVAT